MARALGPEQYRHEDITAADLGEARFDFISCPASLHHVPFGTVSKLRRALAPGGVLAVLGPAKPCASQEFAKWIGAIPPNLGARPAWPPASGSTAEQTSCHDRRCAARIGGAAAGRTVRPLVFWRYLLVYRG